MTVADDWSTVAVPIEVAGGDDGVDAALSLAEVDELDLVPTGAGVDCPISGIGVTGGALASEGSAGSPAVTSSSESVCASTSPVSSDDSVVLVCAPPLLLMVISVPTAVLEEVVPDVVVAPVEVEVSVPVAGVAADSVDESSVDASLVVELAELVDDESEDVSVVSAVATP